MRYILSFERNLSMILLLVMSILAFVQVITRYVLKIPTPWVEETTRYMMIWMVFICMALAVGEKAHLRVELMEFFAPKHVAHWVDVILDAAMLIFGIFFAIITIQFTAAQIEIGQLSPAMQISMGIVYMGMVVGAVLFAIQMAAKLYENIKGQGNNLAGNEGSN